MIRKNYYFTDDDFFVWYDTFKECKFYLKLYLRLPSDEKKKEKEKIRSVRGIIDEYRLFIVSLSDADRKHLKEEVLKRHFFLFDDIRYHPNIFYNWKTIVIDNGKHTIPEFNGSGFAERIKQARIFIGLNRRKASILLGISDRTLKDYEDGKTKVLVNVVYKMKLLYEDGFPISK